MNDLQSVTGRTWRERPFDPRTAMAISQQLGLPEIVGRILASRGIAPHEAEGFLQPTLRAFLPDPFHLKDMDKAARRVAEEIILSKGASASPSSIAIFGDYDVDGATSSALLVRYFRMLGIEPLVHIPDRIKEGYGPNAAALLALKEKGARLVITVDCGTLSFEPLAEAKKAGLDVVVIDHHKGEAKMPECYALVNPNRYDETSPHTQLAACGVVFLLLVAVNKVLKEMGGTLPLPDLMQLLDIVALGTICDVVPLTGPNRAFVTQGLKIMSRRNNPGINAAMDVGRLTEAPTAYHAGFVIGPRINAGGRVGKPDLGVRLLSTDDVLEARAIAAELDAFNAERKAIEALVQEEAMQDAITLPESDAVIVVGRASWHPGVIGIVAGRLKEHFGKPTAVIALKDGVGKASARSIPGIDLGAAVISANQAGLLLGGGGHAMAAGFSVAEDGIQALREFFNQRLASKVAELAREKILHYDGHVSLQGITPDLVQMIERAGPFGAGNHSVRLLLPKVRAVRVDIIGDGHVRAILVDAEAGSTSSGLKCMAFRSADTPIGQTLLNARGKPLHVAGQVKINLWQGRQSVDFYIDDVAC
ncbi:MAG TPA: single-stranded-DNA-specific exonuclease RecJ [Rickettsiales bacterium]|nr:single-stranded-DNA-specific exonuclease RecJ [Rickettsiales bacterium]